MESGSAGAKMRYLSLLSVLVIVFFLAPVAKLVGQSETLTCRGVGYLGQFERALENLLERINTDFADATSALARLDMSTLESKMRDVTFALQLASEEFVGATKHIILACRVTDAVEEYLARDFAPMPGAERLVNLREHLNAANPVHADLIEQCTTVPYVEALTTYSSRIYELRNVDVSALDLLVRYYGASLHYSETVDATRDDCIRLATDTIATVVAQLTLTPEPSDTYDCDWRNPYLDALDNFMSLVDLIDADSPDAPRKVRDYALNLANSLDDIRERCDLP